MISSKCVFILSLFLTLLLSTVSAHCQTTEHSSYKREQDSIRILLMSRKEDKQVLNSVFQELYIRDNVTIADDKLYFDIHLDLHFWDCGAPDMYTHLLQFYIQKNQVSKLPQKLRIRETKIEDGKRSIATNINFELLQSSNDYLIYHAEKLKKTLIIFKSDEKTGTFLYYFQNLTMKKIMTTPVYQIIENGYNESRAPWHSVQLQMDYDIFL